MNRRNTILIGVFATLINTHAAPNVEALTNKLIDLRSEVEELSQQVETKKSDLSSEYKALSSRRNQLEAEIEAAEVKKKLSKERLVAIKNELKDETVDKKAIAPVLENIFQSLATYIQTSLPFQTNKRMDELSKIQDEFNSGVLPAPKAVSKLWAFVEDELRLTRENGLHKFVINVKGEEKLATVAKLGMMNLYFQSGEFEYGMATLENGTYVFQTTEDKDAKKEIIALIDGLKKQIRVGRYSIPNTRTQDLKL